VVRNRIPIEVPEPPKAGNVVVLMPGRGHPIDMSLGLGQLLHGMEQVLADEGLHLTIAWAEEPDRLSRVLSSPSVRGVVLSGASLPENDTEFSREVPAVWVLSRLPGPSARFDQFLPDDERAGMMAAQYLLDAGCRHLAFAHAEPRHPAFEMRGRAFVNAAAGAGAGVQSFVSGVVPETEYRAAWKGLVDRLLEATPRPTGIFVPSDMHTALLYAELQDRGLQPGGDLKVISCNNELAHLMNLRPRPATIDLQTGMIGRVAAEWLLRRMRKHDDLPPVVSMVAPVLVPQTQS